MREPTCNMLRCELEREVNLLRKALKDHVCVGDKVWWKGAFGMDEAQIAIVSAMERTEEPRDKYGVEELTAAPWSLVRANKVLFSLKNGHWAYSEQIKEAL